MCVCVCVSFLLPLQVLLTPLGCLKENIPRKVKWIPLFLSSIYYSELNHILPCFYFHFDFLVAVVLKFFLLW